MNDCVKWYQVNAILALLCFVFAGVLWKGNDFAGVIVLTVFGVWNALACAFGASKDLNVKKRCSDDS